MNKKRDHPLQRAISSLPPMDLMDAYMDITAKSFFSLPRTWLVKVVALANCPQPSKPM